MVPRCHLFAAVGQLSPKPRLQPAHKGGFPLPSPSFPELESGSGSSNDPERASDLHCGEAVGVCGSGEVSACLVKFSPWVFPQLWDTSRATSIPDIAPLRLLSCDEFGPAHAPGGGCPELLSQRRVKADGKESGLSGSGRILRFDFGGNKISSTKHVSELCIIYELFPGAGWIQKMDVP